MLQNIWETLLYEPFVNFLAFLISIIPGGDVGIAVIILTIIVKTVLSPLAHKSLQSQAKMNALAPHLNDIKASGVTKEEQAKKTFELYKKHKTNPFSGCLLMLVQIPIIFALYYVFFRGMEFSSDVLYSFIKVPEQVNMMFLGLIDISGKSMILAVIAGATQFLQAHFTPKPPTPPGDGNDFAASFSKSMHLQMKYFFPIVVTVIAYTISGAIALYWATSNIYSTLQQVYVNKKKIELGK